MESEQADMTSSHPVRRVWSISYQFISGEIGTMDTAGMGKRTTFTPRISVPGVRVTPKEAKMLSGNIDVVLLSMFDSASDYTKISKSEPSTLNCSPAHTCHTSPDKRPGNSGYPAKLVSSCADRESPPVFGLVRGSRALLA